MPREQQVPISHFRRRRNEKTKAVLEDFGGGNLPGQSTHIEYLDRMVVPKSTAQLEESKRFMIAGTFEYCDSFGYYRCEDFAAMYFPPPIDDFIAQTVPNSCHQISQISDPAPASMETAEVHWSPLPRCEPPTDKDDPH
jgi:hypothetical protein